MSQITQSCRLITHISQIIFPRIYTRIHGFHIHGSNILTNHIDSFGHVIGHTNLSNHLSLAPYDPTILAARSTKIMDLLLISIHVISFTGSTNSSNYLINRVKWYNLLIPYMTWSKLLISNRHHLVGQMQYNANTMFRSVAYAIRFITDIKQPNQPISANQSDLINLSII